MNKIRPIAIYLPQFHPVPENDEWWGKGFTEWTNVAKAKPLFEGHYQPHLPADLGFYDLRIAEIREEQAKMAREYGIYGFCYYHYWFNGKRIIERPFQEVFESGKPDFPFMLCWANENWTKVWDGSDKEILLEQKYSAEDDRKHIQSLIPYFKDKRYIRVNDKPVISIYRTTSFPDIKSTLKIWREEAAKHDLELYICRFESLKYGKEFLKDGFDASVEFQPVGETYGKYRDEQLKERTGSLNYKIKDYFLKNTVKHLLPGWYKRYSIKYYLKVNAEPIDYNDYVKFASQQKLPDYKMFPGISPMWDNSSRRKNNPLIFYNSTPDTYKKWFITILKKFTPYSKEENFVFINAWNEWAEGNHLEPDQKWGRQYLQATKEAIASVNESSEKK
jgi:lipopolysaccharide biosynthesis protein